MRREDATLIEAQRLKRYLAEEMVEEYEEGRMVRRHMIKTVGRILGVSGGVRGESHPAGVAQLLYPGSWRRGARGGARVRERYQRRYAGA
jgi:hypothetical protein